MKRPTGVLAHSWLLTISFVGSVLATLWGAQFYFDERDYARAHPNSTLAPHLQDLGFAVTAVGVAGIALTVFIFRYMDVPDR